LASFYETEGDFAGALEVADRGIRLGQGEYLAIKADRLRARLAELDDTRNTAERELEALRGRKEYLEDLERDRDALLDRLMEVAPEALDALGSDERQQLYRMLRLRVLANQDGSLEISGAFGDVPAVCENEPLRS
jgi:hypothetical protein